MDGNPDSYGALRVMLLFLILWVLPVEVFGTEGFGFFKTKVEPILAERCYECHSEEAGKQKGGLWLDRKAAWQQGGDAGAALVPGDAENSLLVHSIRYLDEDLQMPPKNRLPREEIAVLEEWIAMGAPDPRDDALAGAIRKKAIDYEAARQKWAFRSHVNPLVPTPENSSWARGAVDSFLLAELENQKLEPTSDAEPHALVRRVYFDLTGLPPTPEEVAEFVNNPTPEAFSQIVDELLKRPAFGEKWGRHWLDVARYADSNGGDRNFTFHQAWRYRNYVIDSFNRDRSFYEFVRQQVAGDLMSAESDADRHDQLVASGFLSLGPKMLTERDKEKLKLDVADEQADTVGRAFLGLTIGCARCHDHKFDPISQEDYYALAGIFRSTQVVMGTQNGCINVASWVEQPLPGPGGEAAREKVERLELAMKLVVGDGPKRKPATAKSPKAKSDRGLPFGGVILDTEKAEFIGAWKMSAFSPNRIGKGYFHNDNVADPGKKAVFKTELPEAGRFEIRISYNGDDRYAKNIPITVESGGNIHQVVLDQSKKAEVGGLFQPIGQFDIGKGERVSVTLETAGTKGFVICDAVQFINVDAIDEEEAALASVNHEAQKGDDAAPAEKPLLEMTDGELKKELARLNKDLRDADIAMAPRDAIDAGDINLRVRGEVGQLGPVVPRNFPKVLNPGDDLPEIPNGESGRLELADWLTAPENALLDRVMVNRVWHHLFGRGIVKSVDNFGNLGSRPTHPELLDFLATEFRKSGGSVKSLVRTIVMSRAYQLSCAPSEALATGDPKNALFGHQNRRRLTAEEIRDAVLALSGQLEKSVGRNTSLKYGVDLDKPMNYAKESLRTVYLPTARNNPVAELTVFDAANSDLVSGARAETTVPTQALYLLNSDFYKTQSSLIGDDVLSSGKTPDEEITLLYKKILNRPPDAGEISRATAFISEISGSAEDEKALKTAYGHFAHLLLVSTEFLYLE